MKIEQTRWTAESSWQPGAPGTLDTAHLVLAFGSTALMTPSLVETLRRSYPQARLVGCSTAGEICGTDVLDDSIVVTAVQFGATRIRGVSVPMAQPEGSFNAGEQLARALIAPDLAHVLVFSDGLHVNGSELVKGLAGGLPSGVAVTGGLSGDGARFGKTLVFFDAPPRERSVVAIGLYGSRLRVGYGSLGGWDPFGPERVITRSKGNVLYELDGRSALDLYRQYLGEHAAGLPASGLLFPLALRTQRDDTPVVRTILSVDEAAQSLTFAGDVPEGAYARLMKANFDRLIDGATDAARRSQEAIGQASPELALLISCVGRKLVLKQRIEDEVEGVREVLGAGTMLTGFYSYGEISPFTPSARCELHNQTMTITTLSEV